MGAFELRSGDPEFGGISAVRRDGAMLYLLSDRSILFEVNWPEVLREPSFTLPVRAKRRFTTAGGRLLDSEALVLGRRGEVLVGDETEGHIFTFAQGKTLPEGQPVRLPQAFAVSGVTNQGLETLTRLPDGTLLAIVEGASSNDGVHVAAALVEGGQQDIAYRAGDGFQVTDAEVAGGWLLVLERRLSLLGGWHGRIVALALEELQAADRKPIMGRALATIAGSILGENYEGLAAIGQADGSIAMLIIADNNFNPFQRTQLVALRWRP